ncbi:hybrid sensor histidine kinase/response regulator [Anaeromyxobacter diazotrophicus]|uniref:histidine kinase n=1 Tax=Anaeromyxobacter diazotrophicus TaxID=2590199 RepID=A0A7I9VH09_9BACT|nr:chemotaxis protein CheW [Anaeromyxobacter diazotrophicus]GEJ55676.1 hybrid sensor histidine kinase/response regulator [Anaeromyxobacter diazotrophicus]
MGSQDDIRQKLLGKFREVTADRLEKIGAGLLALERGDAGEAGAEVARELHTLKGEARMLGFSGLAQVVHAAEDVLRALPSGPSAAAGARVQALLEACDAVPPLLDGPPDGGEAAQGLAARLKAAAAGAPSPTPAPTPTPTATVPPTATATPAVTPTPSSAATANAMAAAAARRARAGEAKSSRRLELRAPTGSIRVDVDRLDEIAALSGDLLVEGARAEGRSRELAALLARWSRLADRFAALTAPGVRDVPALAGRIDDDVHLLRSDTFRFLRRHSDAVSAVHGQMAHLAERVGSARLLPLAGILAGFPRAARDLAREQGKEVECEVKGGEAGVDKAILLSLNDPLVHLVRNAVDHGLEAPADRERAGKPRAGRLVITARIEGDQLALSVEDDGRGLDPERLRAVALARALAPAAQLAAMAPQALHELIFLPGFSTREAAGEISGRGVGLDVVRRKTVELGGSAVVESEPGRFTRFTLRVPQSLALMKVLLLRLGEDVYGVPASDVESVGRLDPAAVTEVAGVRALRLRDRLVPIVALGPLLGLDGGPRQRRPAVVFLTHGADAAALAVDGLAGEREVAVKACGAFLDGARFVSGAAALEDGRVALLLSTPELIAAARRTQAPLPDAPAAGRRRLRVLLVDDSAIAREAEAALLRALGHEVEEAVDGEDGWRRLAAGQHQLLVTDVQMPVLDGIGLTRRVKGSPRLARLPVVVLSSLSAPEDRRRGLDAGADAYLVKGDLDAALLAQTVERLCGAGT